MAVYGTRIFLSLDKVNGIPVSLVSLPTSSASSASPKLTPFPSWDMHRKDDCNQVEEAKGLQVDSVGRLWVLDKGSDNCYAKLLIFDLTNDDHTELIHRFSFYFFVNDFVLDETPNDTFAYIERWNQLHIVVFSLQRKESWIVETPGFESYSIALSPKEEPRQLYLSNWNANGLFSISVTALRNGTRIAYPTLIGIWTAMPYRMLIDSHGTVYAAFWRKSYISLSKGFQEFEEQPFYEVEKLGTSLPFTFALDSSGTFWMTELNKTAGKPSYRLLKSAVGTMSKRSSRFIPNKTKSTTDAEETSATEVQESSTLTEDMHQYWLINMIVICSIVFSAILFNLYIFVFILRIKKNYYSLPQSTNDAQQWSNFRDNKDDVGPAEVRFEEVTYTTTTRSPQHPLRLMPTSRQFFSPRDLSESDTSDAEDGDIWRGVSSFTRD
ncbi:Hypothetical predicted protein [Cloeon dipterum]|uniref:Uncharacterized protein n=1 Tax=Cloeon dipterum TaxID=197152 RepID=A0A8S1D249_9INSE|nr:Hypothetical predicted protein [Cloeon dipterum]